MFVPEYTLSTRQRKELFERGYNLYLAIPDPGWTGDPEEIVRKLLPEVADEPSPRVIVARRGTVPVDPVIGGDGVTGVLGSILTDEEARDNWSVKIAVLLVELATRVSRSHDKLWQWPKTVTTAARQHREMTAKL